VLPSELGEIQLKAAFGLRAKTSTKIFIAQAVLKMLELLPWIKAKIHHYTCSRFGIRWELDLAEVIDLSIFLLGFFELRVFRAYSKIVGQGDLVLDVGANRGAHTLWLAKLVGYQGKVIAFEPTVFAFEKLKKSLEMNPALASRVVALQAWITGNSEGSHSTLPQQVFSSWRLDSVALPKHALHGGIYQSTSGAQSYSIDNLWSVFPDLDPRSLKFIKVDIDGFEPLFVNGAKETLKKYKPKILMEFAPYMADEVGQDFDQAICELVELGYRFHDVETHEMLSSDSAEIRKMIGVGSSRNVLLTPGSPSI